MMSDYVAARLAQVFILAALGLGILGFVEEFLL